MDVAVIQIGNSDDKLDQVDWSSFVYAVNDIILEYRYKIHFHGVSVGSAPWQNACWVLEIESDKAGMAMITVLRRELARVAKDYCQDSIALSLGDTEFVKGE
jgi:hypothetical protein